MAPAWTPDLLTLTCFSAHELVSVALLGVLGVKSVECRRYLINSKDPSKCWGTEPAVEAVD